MRKVGDIVRCIWNDSECFDVYFRVSELSGSTNYGDFIGIVVTLGSAANKLSHLYSGLRIGMRKDLGSLHRDDVWEFIVPQWQNKYDMWYSMMNEELT